MSRGMWSFVLGKKWFRYGVVIELVNVAGSSPCFSSK